MNLAETLLQEFQKLTEDKQRNISDFIGFSRTKEQKKSENMMDDVITDYKEAFLGIAK